MQQRVESSACLLAEKQNKRGPDRLPEAPPNALNQFPTCVYRKAGLVDKARL
jgi:hypothetical protein